MYTSKPIMTKPTSWSFGQTSEHDVEAHVAIEDTREDYDSIQRQSSSISSSGSKSTKSSSQSIINQLQDHNRMLQEQNATLTNTVASFFAAQANKDKANQVRDG